MMEMHQRWQTQYQRVLNGQNWNNVKAIMKNMLSNCNPKYNINVHKPLLI